MQGSSPIGWNCRRFVLVPFYCKTSSHWFLGLIDIFVLVGNAPIGQFELLLLIQILAGKFDFWREIWMLAGRLLMSFPVHHFRWRHFLSFPVTSGDIISVDATSGDVTAPDCSTTNMTWMVLLYLDKKSGFGTNRCFRVVDNKMYTYLQERAGFSYFYPKRKVLDNGYSTEPLDI